MSMPIGKEYTPYCPSPNIKFFGRASPTIEKRLMAFLTYVPALLVCALLIVGLRVRLCERIAVDRWLLFSALLAGCLSAFPQFFFFRPDLPHLIEFLNGGLVALTCAGWLLWSSKGKIASPFPSRSRLPSWVSGIFHSPFQIRTAALFSSGSIGTRSPWGQRGRRYPRRKRIRRGKHSLWPPC